MHIAAQSYGSGCGGRGRLGRHCCYFSPKFQFLTAGLVGEDAVISPREIETLKMA